MDLLNILNNILNPIALYNPQRKANRKTYLWEWIYPYILLALIGGLLDAVHIQEGAVYNIFIALGALFMISALFLITVRRLKDLDRDAWQVVFLLIPALNNSSCYLEMKV